MLAAALGPQPLHEQQPGPTLVSSGDCSMLQWQQVARTLSMSGLERLVLLDHTQLGNQGITLLAAGGVASCSSLQALRLAGCSIRPAGAQQLGGASTLQRLTAAA